jgi:hypothetical protein
MRSGRQPVSASNIPTLAAKTWLGRGVLSVATVMREETRKLRLLKEERRLLHAREHEPAV